MDNTSKRAANNQKTCCGYTGQPNEETSSEEPRKLDVISSLSPTAEIVFSPEAAAASSAS